MTISATITDLCKLLGTAPKTNGQSSLAGITADSRQVAPGWLFVAERGVNVDGHSFIGKALQQGAVAIVCEEIPANANEYPEVEWIQVDDSTKAMGKIAAWWYGYPSSKLSLVGVTGTNGKTTIATLIYEMARLMGEKAGLLSTVVNKVDNRCEPAKQTTPDILTINRLLSEMVDAGCTVCAMEVSSHACQQQRIAGLEFVGGVFTNLTRDHLDYHKTFDAYLKAKKSFFDSLPERAFALVNNDDRHGSIMLQNCKAKNYTYALASPADFKGRVIEDRLDGMLMSFDGTEVEVALTGRFNASNLTAVYATSLLLGWDRDDVLRAISQLRPVDGRMQTIVTPTGVTTVVDYAHTPDALANVLATLAEVKAPAAQIITVTGAGGDRDRGKRPLMAAQAAALSDVVILTSDNPRSEDPAQIIAEMLEGVPAGTECKVLSIIDRREAIAHALKIAQKGDVVLVAGKGHETYQEVNGIRHHFDDREEILSLTPNT